MSFQALQSTGSATPAAFASDTAGLSIPDDLDIRVRVTLETWGVPPVAAIQSLVSKRHGGNEWQFGLSAANGRPQLLYWVSSSGSFPTADDDLPFTDGQTGWVRVRREGTDIDFFYSEDDTNDHTAVSWTQLGTTQAGGAGNIDDVATLVTIGAFGGGGGAHANGFYHAVAIVEDTTDRGNPVFADPSEWTVGEDSADTAVDAAGVTWQLSTQGRIIGDNLQGAYVSVQAGFGTNPVWGADGSAVDWTDLTDDMRAVSFQRGRQYELDRINAGTMTVTLSNAAGDYNAHNTAGAYYPDIKPMVPIRLVALYDNVFYPLWQGFVERWPVSFPAQVDSVVEVQCVDLFKALSLADSSQPDRTTAVEALSPVAWWRFEDETDSAGGNNTLTFAGSPTEGGATNLPWEGDVATTFDGTNDDATVASESDVERETLDRTWECWVRPTGTGIDYVYYVAGGVSVLSALAWNASTAQWVITGGFSIISMAGTANEWAHLVIADDVGASTTARTVYRNGVVAGSATFANPSATWAVRIGSQAGSGYFAGDISEIAVYPTALTATEVAGLFAAKAEAYITQRTDERIAYILSDSSVGIGAEFVFTDLEEGQTTMSGSNSPTDVSALEAIQVAADTELGQFFMTGNGYARFHDRYYRLMNQETPIDTFGPSDLPYVDVRTSLDDERIYNDIRVSPSGNTDPFIAQDETSIQSYGRRTLSLTTYPSDLNEGYDFAHALKQIHAEPTTRIEAVDFRLGGDLDLWPVILDAELGNRYTVDVPLAGDDLNQDVYLEAISHTITRNKTWDVTFQLSPAADDTFWLLGVTGSSELGETTNLGF